MTRDLYSPEHLRSPCARVIRRLSEGTGMAREKPFLFVVSEPALLFPTEATLCAAMSSSRQLQTVTKCPFSCSRVEASSKRTVSRWGSRIKYSTLIERAGLDGTAIAAFPSLRCAFLLLRLASCSVSVLHFATHERLRRWKKKKKKARRVRMVRVKIV